MIETGNSPNDWNAKRKLVHGLFFGGKVTANENSRKAFWQLTAEQTQRFHELARTVTAQRNVVRRIVRNDV
jgi:hypothetical protein